MTYYLSLVQVLFTGAFQTLKIFIKMLSTTIVKGTLIANFCAYFLSRYLKTCKKSCLFTLNVFIECKFYVPSKQHEQVHQPWIRLPSLPPKASKQDIQLGYLKHISVLLYPKRDECRVKSVQWWDLKEWRTLDELFTVQEKSKKHILEVSYQLLKLFSNLFFYTKVDLIWSVLGFSYLSVKFHVAKAWPPGPSQFSAFGR